jgi:predicted RNA-binding protein YlxR (DUF448 family)
LRETSTSERTCIVTRQVQEPEAMIRFVRAPDGGLAPDIRSRLPGRGVYVTGTAERVAEAVRKQLFSRGFKAKVDAPAGLAQEVDALLERDCLQMLSLANKAGLALTGFGKVAEALEKGAVAALVEATDGGEDGRRKLGQSARRGAAASGVEPKIVTIFDSAQLDLALGRTNVIHAALAAGGPTAAFLTRCERLVLYRGEKAGETSAQTDDGRASAPLASAEKQQNFEQQGRDCDRGSGTE